MLPPFLPGEQASGQLPHQPLRVSADDQTATPAQASHWPDLPAYPGTFIAHRNRHP